jgi:hypothetical protein
MPTNSDFKDLFKIFNDEGVEFLIVGAHAVIFYAEPRFTKDLDIWVNPTAENAARVWRGLEVFTAPLTGVREEDFTKTDLVFQMGMPPNRIDIVMGIDGLTFEEAWPNRVRSSYAGEPICLLSKNDLIKNKQASGRPQDLLDVQRLLESES